MRQIVHQPHGLLLSCGPTGAGKSTTLYASLKDVDAYQLNVITVEDPIEYKMRSTSTRSRSIRRAGQTFASSLRSILRQDPDVLMIGEIRDGETATIACQAANTGHMVFSTVHANDSITAVYRMLELLASSRSWWPTRFRPSSDNAWSGGFARSAASRISPAATFWSVLKFRPIESTSFSARPTERRGCVPNATAWDMSGGREYSELLVVNDELRDLVRDKAAASKVKLAAKRNGMLTMKQEGDLAFLKRRGDYLRRRA